MQGVKFFLGVKHRDYQTWSDELVTFDILYESLSPGIESDGTNFSFHQINIVLSFRLVCAQNYYGQNCYHFCKESCIWDQEFTGESCKEFEDCTGIDCGENQECLDGLDHFTCVCYPGYNNATEKNCDVNMCHVMNISHYLRGPRTGTIFNTTMMLIGIVGALVGVVIILLLAMALVIRALKKKGE